MNTTTAMKPMIVAFTPWSMFSCPSDGALLDDLHRRRERAGAQQQRQLVGLLHAVHALDLEALAELASNHRRGDDLLHPATRARLAPVFVQHRPTLGVEPGLGLDLDVYHRHALADVLAGDALVDGRAARVERDGDDRAAALAVEAGRGVHDVVTGIDQAVLEQDRAAVAHLVELRAERHV